MLLVYCETCGFRLPEADVASGAAVLIDENKYLCAKCAAVAEKKPLAGTKVIARKTPEGSHAIRSGPDEARVSPIKIAALPHILPAASNVSAHARAAAGTAKNAPKKSDSTRLVIGGVCAALVLVIGAVFAFSGKKDDSKTVARPAEKALIAPAAPGNPAQKVVSPETPAPGVNKPEIANAANTPPVTPSTTLQERQRIMDRELEELKFQRAAKLLEEHKAWFQTRPDDPWSYKERLSALANTYRSTPAALEAGKILGETKIPDGEPSPDSRVWHRSWDLTRGNVLDMFDSFDGRRFVLSTHPLEAGKPFMMNRKVKVPADKSIYEFNLRAHENGEFKFIITVDGKSCFNEDIRGRGWRTFALDLTSLKGREVELSFQHHTHDWQNEHAWWTAPRFAAAASPGARIVSPDGAAVAAPPSVAAVPPATPPAPPGVADARVWRQLFDGKSLDCLLRQGFNGWRVENNALVNTGPEKNAAQTDLEIEDGSLRVRFEIKDAQYAHFTIRQGEQNGYAVTFDRSQVAAMNGKPQELIFVCRGDDVSATLNGQPTTVTAGKTRNGRLQFYASHGVIRIFSLEFAEWTSAPPAAPATPVAATDTVKAEAGVQYETLLADVFALLAKNSLAPALARIETARADAKLSAMLPLLERDARLVQLMTGVNQAVAKGAAALVDKRSFILRRNDGKELAVGKGGSGTVLDVKDETLQVEQNLGGGKAVLRWSLEQLTLQTRFELAKVGLTGATDGDLKLALIQLVMLNAGMEVSPKTIRMHLDAAAKENAPAELIAQLAARLAAREREQAAEMAVKKMNTLAKDKKWADLKSSIENMRKEFGGTLTIAKAQSVLEQRYEEALFNLNPIRPGLWGSYFNGDEQNKFKTLVFAQAETKLNYDWGDNAPDPRVQKDNFGIRWAGKLRVAVEGKYRFKGGADDSQEVYLDGKKLKEKDQEVEITLSKGDHEFQIFYFDQSRGARNNLEWRLEGGFDWQELPAGALWHDPRQIEKYQKGE